MDALHGDGLDPSPTGAHNEDRLIRYPAKVNVFRSIRGSLKLSHQDVADQTHLSRLYVIRAEQGVYPMPSHRLVNWALQAAYEHKIRFQAPNTFKPLSEADILDQYRDYQRRCRQENGPHTNHPLLTENLDLFRVLLRKGAPLHQTREHPFRLWLRDGRYSLSVMQACKAFCISPTLLQRFVAEPYRVHNVPVPVLDALREAGYKNLLLDLLEEAYKAYRKSLYRRSYDRASSKEDGGKEENEQSS